MTTMNKEIPQIVGNQLLASASHMAHNRPTPPNAWSAALTLGWRAVLKLKHVPSQIVDVTMFPILMILLFTYIFGGALANSVDAYLQQLLPGILVATVAMISMYTAVGLNMDISKGIFDRFRSLPFWQPAVLVGALLGDMIRYMIAALVVVGLGLILGFRPEAGMSGVLLSLGFLLIFAFSLSWIWTALGLLMDDSESVMMASQMTSFPLTFLSNVFVDPATMPALLQPIVNTNPVSLIVTAVRGAMHGTLTTAQVGYMILSCMILVAIFAPITMYLYYHKNTV